MPTQEELRATVVAMHAPAIHTQAASGAQAGLPTTRTQDTNAEVLDLVREIHEAALFGGVPLSSVPDLAENHPLRREWITFKREVKRLIAERHQGRFALIKGDKVISVWDTERDALQAGDEQFGREPFMVQEVQRFLRSVRSGYSRICHS